MSVLAEELKNSAMRGSPTPEAKPASRHHNSMFRGVEALVPVLDPTLQARIEEVLHLCLTDDRLAWSLGPDGRWQRPTPGGVRNVQSRLQELAANRVGRRELPA